MLPEVLAAAVNELVGLAVWIAPEALEWIPPFLAGDPPELRDAYETASEILARDPSNARAYFQRAAVCRIKGWHQEAMANLLEVIRLEPKNAQAWLLSSEVLANLGYHDKAREARQIAMELETHVQSSAKKNA
jgi:tetratricopeptide (TPR) repeat protein